MAVGGARSGGGSFVTKRTRTWRDVSASMAAAAAADGRRVCGGGNGLGRVLGRWKVEGGLIWLGFWSLRDPVAVTRARRRRAKTSQGLLTKPLEVSPYCISRQACRLWACGPVDEHSRDLTHPEPEPLAQYELGL
jgi:hypothetical protein